MNYQSPLLLSAISLSISLTSGFVMAASDTSVVQKVLDVHKTTPCVCCAAWVEALQNGRYQSHTVVDDDLSVTGTGTTFTFPNNDASCHTVMTREGYLFEGHIPEKLVLQFLANPPKGARGLVVPIMPLGSPGTEFNNNFMSYSVLLLNEDGTVSPYAEISRPEDQY